ncbi:MAG: hypothetical protein INR66_12740 [Gordonia polyisoprenivorans]|nr:hypothetical protein [Gordonia polyisoprenivorans]
MTAPTTPADTFPDLSTELGERLAPGDFRGITAHANYGRYQNLADATTAGDSRIERFRRPATDLEIAILRHIGALEPDDPRAVSVTLSGSGHRTRTYSAGRQVLTDPRLDNPQEPTP